FEFVKGKTAHELLDSQGHLPIQKVVVILRPICQALEFAHAKNFVHRDIKPYNIMVLEDGGAKLMDFGIARLLNPKGDKAEVGRTRHVTGTPEYMAPECWNGEVRKESDIYSLGVTLYEMLTGSLPPPRDPNSKEPAPMPEIAGGSKAINELLA